ncbi:hypothetical protein [Streptomyces sp. NPDC058701]|uniref:hypothetical protein n=1 Tax=Streptomyces sp. NPDC058701 TaxID=3346608 RepID=UPI00365A8C6A
MHNTEAASLARRTMNLLRAVARAAGEGSHRLSITLLTASREVHRDQCLITGPVLDEEDEASALPSVAMLLARTGLMPDDALAMVILYKTNPDDDTVSVMSWAVAELTALPASATQSIQAYHADEERDITDWDPNLTFVDAPALT